MHHHHEDSVGYLGVAKILNGDETLSRPFSAVRLQESMFVVGQRLQRMVLGVWLTLTTPQSKDHD